MPSVIRSWTSMVEETENSMKRAKSAGRNLPNPSAMLRAADDTASRIWSRNLKSADADPAVVSVCTSRRNWSASCHASSSSYRLAIPRRASTRFVPFEQNGEVSERAAQSPERSEASRTISEARTSSAVSRTIGEASRTISAVSRTIGEASRTIGEARTNSAASRTNSAVSRTTSDSLPNAERCPLTS